MNRQRQQAIEEATVGRQLDPLEHFREQARHPRIFAALVELDVGVIALAGEDDQVLGRVVGAVAVPVVDDLTGQQRAAQELRRQHAVRQQALACMWVTALAVRFAALDGSPPVPVISPASRPPAQGSVVALGRLGIRSPS